jgi:polysaccharide biosynthesis/export protein
MHRDFAAVTAATLLPIGWADTHRTTLAYRFLLILALVAATPGRAAPQIPQLPIDPRQVEQLRGGLRGQIDPDRPRAAEIHSGPLLEGEISRTDYLLGPGDILTLSVFGYRSDTYSLSVAPEGTVVIPEVGVVRVGRMNLEQAQQAVARQVRRFNRDAEVNLSLAAVRSFKVFLLGDVENPGAREATPVTRVSELFAPRHETPNARADTTVRNPVGSFRNPEGSIRPLEGMIRRNVTVRRTNGTVINADLARFLHLGELEHNPLLREGDIVTIPRVDRTVTVLGQVAYPGEYEYRPTDTLAELLRIVNGGDSFRGDAADTLRLMRFSQDDSRGSVIALALPEASDGLGRQLQIEPFDAIFVPRVGRYGQYTTAVIDGEVMRPGTYPIQPEVTTIRDLVEMAGGFTPEASLIDAVLRREPVNRPRDDVRRLENVPPEFLTRNELRIIQVTGRADDRTVVVDFRRLFDKQADVFDVPLQSGDRIHVPPHRSEVTVLGAVGRPGIVSHQPGMSVDDFVALAGGYNRRADRKSVVVLRAASGGQLDRREVETLDPGDRIIVPFREPATVMERTQQVAGIVNTVAGVMIAVYTISRIWRGN